MQIGNNPYSYNIDFYSRAQAQEQAVSNQQGTQQDTRGLEKNESSQDSKNNSQENPTNQTELSADEKAQVQELKARDAQVRAHEAAHQSGAAASGGASFTYEVGPDGATYAVSGEVPVRISSGSTPEQTMANAQAVIATALAPADPSPQDLSVASQARVMMMKAQQEFAQELQEKMASSEGSAKNAISK